MLYAVVHDGKNTKAGNIFANSKLNKQSFTSLLEANYAIRRYIVEQTQSLDAMVYENSQRLKEETLTEMETLHLESINYDLRQSSVRNSEFKVVEL